jgi:hypothetical protein
VLFDCVRPHIMGAVVNNLREQGVLSSYAAYFPSAHELPQTPEISAILQDALTVSHRVGLVKKALSTPARLTFSQIEDELGLDCAWDMVKVDRELVHVAEKGIYFRNAASYDRAGLERILSAAAMEALRLLDTARPDAVFLTELADVTKYAVAALAHKRGIPVLHFLPFRVGKWMALANSPFEHFHPVYERYRSVSPDGLPLSSDERTRRFSESLLGGRSASHEAGKLNAAGPGPMRKQALLEVYASLRRGQDLRVRETFKVWWRRWRDKPDFQSPPGDDFVYFPLHSEPETAIALNAPHISSQIELAAAVSRLLPRGLTLIVKDHPRMWGLRPKRDLQELADRCPNIRLAHPLDDSNRFTRAAKVVFVIAGTAGLEAQIMGVPVIAFGACHFQILPGVQRCLSLSNLPSLVNQALEIGTNPGGIQEAASRYLRAGFEEGIEVSWYREMRRNPLHAVESPDFADFTRYLGEGLTRAVRDPAWPVPFGTGRNGLAVQ